VTRDEALARLASPDQLGYEVLDLIFLAFGIVSDSPTWETEVYYHPRWHHQCGAFTARDDGIHVLTPLQRKRVRAMLECVQFCEQF
jgi:hypothetical protein